MLKLNNRLWAVLLGTSLTLCSVTPALADDSEIYVGAVSTVKPNILLLIDTGAWLTMGCPSSKDGTPGGFCGIYRIRKTDGQLPDDPHHRVERGGRVVPHRDIERLSGDIFFRAIGDGAFHAGGDRLDDRRLEQLRLGRVRKLVGQCSLPQHDLKAH